MEKALGRSPPAEKKKSYKSDFLLNLQMIFCKIRVFRVYEEYSESCQF